MALVGSANVVVRVLTNSVSNDIRRGFRDTDKIGGNAGTNLGRAFSKGFNQSAGDNVFARFRAGLRAAFGDVEGARRAFENLNRAGQFVGVGLATLVGGISSLVGGLGSLIGTAAGAGASLSSLGNIMFSLVAAMSVAKLALSGVGKALSALNKAGGGGGGGGGAAAAQAQAAAQKAVESAEKQLALTIERNREQLLEANNDVRDSQMSLNEAIKAGREEIQQLGFDAEDAALSEKKASLDLEKARIALAKAQDLPPNSRVRQEAELAYQEAELNYRKAKDRSADLNKEQDRLAKTGVKGTQGVISATNALAQAEANRAKIVRDALRSEADANANLADAKDNAAKAGDTGGGGGGADPLAGLNQAQIDFVNFIQTEVMPLLKTLKETASNAFLPLLTDAIRLIASGAFDTINKGVEQIGIATGKATISIAQAIVNSQNLAKLGTLFTTTAKLIETFGVAIGNVYGIFLSVLNFAAPAAQRFADSITTATAKFGAFLDAPQNAFLIEDFFKRSADAAAQLGRIFGNIFGGLGAIIQANLGPGTGGQYLLDWLETATQKFNDLDATFDGKMALRDFFNDVAVNSQKILSAVGALATEFVKLGANQNIGLTFDALAKGAPALGEIANKLVDAGPAFGELIANIVQVINLLNDTNTSKFFFITLNEIVVRLRDFLSGELVQSILAAIAPFQGIALAIGGIVTVALLAGRILGGYLGLFSGIGAAASGLLSALAGPLGIILALSAAFLYLYNTSESFHNAINGIATTLLGTVMAAFTQVSGVVQGVLPQLMSAFSTLITSLLPVLSSLFLALASAVSAILQAVIPFVANVLSAVIPAITGIIEAVLPLIPLLLDGLVKAFNSILIAVIPIIPMLLDLLLPAITGLISVILPLIKTVLPILVKVFGQVLDAIIPVVVGLLTLLIPVIKQVLDAVIPLVTSIISTLVPAFTAILSAVLPLIGTLVSALMPAFLAIVQAILPLITTILGALIPAVTSIIDAVLPIITMLIEEFVPVFTQIINAIIPLITLIIEALVPVITSVVEAIAPLITQIIEALVPAFVQILDAVMPIISALLDALIPIIGALIEILNFLMPIIKLVIDVALTPLQYGIQLVSGVLTYLIGVIKSVIDLIVAILVPVITTIITVLSNVIGFIVNVFTGNWAGAWDNIVNIFRGIVNGIIGIFEGMINFIIDGINNMVNVINPILQGLKTATGGAINIQVGRIPHFSIPRLADGGTVFPSRGGSIVNVAEAGRPERIEPLDENGLSDRDKAWAREFVAAFGSGAAGVNIHVTQLPNENGEELAERISRILSFKMRKGALT